MIDRIRLEQVLFNIIGNAAKYSPAGSQIEIGSYQEDDHLHVEVTDHGIGMAPEITGRIFDKFYRDDDAAKRYN